MSICALVGAVEFNSDHFLSQEFHEVIAVDRGYKTLCDNGIVPDYVVGDFDSLGHVPSHGEVFVHPSEKDESDMELAIRLAQEHGHNVLMMYGAWSGRIDHTFANIQLLVQCGRQGIKAYGIGSDFIVAALNGKAQKVLSFRSFEPAILDEGSQGRFISVFPFGGSAFDVCESGFKYGLSHRCLVDDTSLGLSNEFTGSNSSISVEEGDLVVFFSSGAWEYLE